ncbi:class I SAM-dependent methyltransferase [Anaerotignum lactatifermentans]|uniref:Class I SAM-dependent methyltransferase n=1 Tax=Anaerotignum lactatifermentans TaxID=160404 RepID=A0ABS2G826_9FIRM|nr:class I SAM-dependent methyltransferase [Anaerotignum lactatifermentans]MBM6828336.1 class I SAM-dependent methyltransferase [Anaerotignum lactatifermentans]MBM6877616.1 class I SAM-dependent methyltransferase [Anaerotignum lactatifermentans]MBM6949919.1 class I SAM-dependent methyltransferase [Anaerotignum lactatifermentans]
METYQLFASVYDIFMDEIPYEAWIDFLREIWQKEGVHPQRITDLGCGTGNVLLPLARAGYEMTGVDLSYDMLAQAEHKLRQENLSARLLAQDMTEFSLPEKADCIISLCDCLNYLTEDGELSAAFGCVAEHLAEDGLFFFDMNTAYKFREIYGDNTYASVEEDAAYIWENTYDEEDSINEYAVNFFLRRPDGSYERTEEYHYERAYSMEEIEQALEENGLCVAGVYDDYRWQAPEETCQRICVLAKKRKEKTEEE